ncbi:MAG: HAMP domain-containing histidine kinase [Planctomycetota bacterium]|nr:HAMP domain-containing histidine kinase [Planctomycetota bacterium]
MTTAEPEAPSDPSSTAARLRRLPRFNLLRYFTGASLLVIAATLLAASLLAGRVVYDVFLEIEREEADSLVEDLLDRMAYEGYGPERWGQPVDAKLDGIVRAKLENFGILEFALLNASGREHFAFAAEGRPRAEHAPKAFDRALKGEPSLTWHSRYPGPLVLISEEGSTIDTYVPVRDGEGRVTAVAHLHRSLEIVLPKTRLLLPRLLVLAGLSASVIFLALWFLVRKADRIMERQQEQIAEFTSQLAERNRLLEEYNRRKDEFLAICSHDLRSPLNSIFAGCKVLAAQRLGELNGKQTEINAENLKKARQMIELIDDLLDLSRIEAGREDLNVETFDLTEKVRESIASHQQLAAAKQVKLELRAPEGELRVEADPLKVLRISNNLVSNAIKYSAPGLVEVELRGDGESARLCVTDHGPGIPAALLPNLFDKYSGLARKQKTRAEGTGLGLAITQELVRLHGGSLEVRSEEGRGAAFTVTLPRARSKPVEA